MVIYDAEEIRRELDAMTTIAWALESLDHPVARLRVMRWAIEKFQVEGIPSAPLAQGAGIESIEPPVTESTDATETRGAAEQISGKEPLDVLFRGLAADFQRLALERHRA